MDNVGIRWQADMEDHLIGVRENLRIHDTVPHSIVMERTAKAQVHAVAALALAVANGLGDIEAEINGLARTIGEGMDNAGSGTLGR